MESNNAKFLENHQNNERCDTRKINYGEVRDVKLPNKSGIVVPLDVNIQEVQLQPNERDVTLDNINIDTQVDQQPINNETLPGQTVEGDQIPNITQLNVSEINIDELRRSTRVKRPAITDDYVVYLEDTDIGIKEDLRTFKEAINSDNSDKRMESMIDELKSIAENNIWDLVELPKGSKTIGWKWAFKTKRDSKRKVERFKARLIVKGFTQR